MNNTGGGIPYEFRKTEYGLYMAMRVYGRSARISHTVKLQAIKLAAIKKWLQQHTGKCTLDENQYPRWPC